MIKRKQGMYGKKHTEKTKLKMSKTAKQVWQRVGYREKMSAKLKMAGVGKWRKGMKMSDKTKEKLRINHLDNKNAYIDGRSFKKPYKHHYNYKYNNWRKKVYERDNYTCKNCNNRNGSGYTIKLVAHHIKSYTHYPKLRYKISNGITLCQKCHKNTDNFRGKGRQRKEK